MKTLTKQAFAQALKEIMAKKLLTKSLSLNSSNT